MRLLANLRANRLIGRPYAVLDDDNARRAKVAPRAVTQPEKPSDLPAQWARQATSENQTKTNDKGSNEL